MVGRGLAARRPSIADFLIAVQRNQRRRPARVTGHGLRARRACHRVIDRFGYLPPPAQNLFRVTALKLVAQGLGVGLFTGLVGAVS